MTSIARNTDGIIDYCLSKVEEIDSRDDMDMEKKLGLGLKMLKEAREAAKLNMQYKVLMMKAPDVAKNSAIVLQLGSPQVREAETTAELKKATA
jgi:hypothetical protein